MKSYCNTRTKRARPSVTVESWTKQLFVESYSASRQDMLQLLQTWETKFFIKWSFSGNKKLFTSKEVKEFPKMCQKSNFRSVRDKNRRKSMLECTGNTSASWPLNQQRYHLLSQKQESSIAYSTRISKVQVLMIKHSFYVDFGWIRAAYSLRDKMHYCLMTAFVVQPISCHKKEIVSF